jgi:metal-responsive CopG/Arc/MetJ family transcriptional regulator
VKTKLSVTLEEALVEFVDTVAGASRSEKIEAIVRRYRDASRDAKLRKELAAFIPSGDDEAESTAWRQAMEEAQWNESGAATSGRSRSRRSPSRDRR